MVSYSRVLLFRTLKNDLHDRSAASFTTSRHSREMVCFAFWNGAAVCGMAGCFHGISISSDYATTRSD
jgi:hypothetical protein